MEIFTVCKVQKTQPITYKLKDARNQILDREVYEHEILKVKYPDMYLIEKVVKRCGNKLYVKWLGFDSTSNLWIDKSEL